MKKLLTLSIIALGLTLTASIAFANPIYISKIKYLDDVVATTTVSTVNPAGTKSFVFDSFSDGSNYLPNKAWLLTQYTASTSAGSLGVSVSYSLDGVDYFGDTIDLGATTTPAQNIGIARTYTLPASDSASTTRTALTLSVPVRYLKVTYTGNTATSTLWAAIISSKEISN